MNKASQPKGQKRMSRPALTVDKSVINFSLTTTIDQHGWVNPLPTSPIESKQKYIILEGPKRKKRIPWCQSEDNLLLQLVQDSGSTKPNWSKIAYEIKEAIETIRTGKQCRERWLNHLRPHIHKGNWTVQEEAMIRYYYNSFGPKWSCMAKVMKNRTDNDIKNKWNSMQRTEGRGAIAAITAPTYGVTRSNGHDRSSACQSEYESSSWRPRALVTELSTIMPLQPFLSTNTIPSLSSLHLSDLGIPAVVTDRDNDLTTSRTDEFDWENKVQFQEI